MHNVSTIQALRIWSELWQAYYKNNGYGGDTAEIYAYSLMPHAPPLEDGFGFNGFNEFERMAALQSAESLYTLLQKFREESECEIEVDGKKLGKWFTAKPFLNRCLVKIIRNDEQ